MAEDKRNTGGEINNVNTGDMSIGNRQGTTQTGAQNNGGDERHQHNDAYTKDLKESGNRQASNEKAES